MTIEQLFFELIQVSLESKMCLSHSPTNEEWRMLYDMAKKQSLLGICFAGIQRLGADADEGFEKIGLTEKQYLKWMGMAARIQQRNEVVNRQCVDLQKRLAADGLRSSILKGQGIGALYGNQLSMLRQPGDIDIWIPNGMMVSMSWIKLNYGDVRYDYINAHVPVYPDTEVELHWRAQAMKNLFDNKKLQKWLELDEVKEIMLGGHVVQTDGSVLVVPTAEFNLFYILLHCYHHMFDEGLGLRQLMDYYFVLKSAKGSVEQKQNVLEKFREFGMMKFVSAVMWIMQRVFGLEDAFLLCSPNKTEGEFILRQVMRGGNFGHHDDRRKKFKSYRIQSLVGSTQHNWHLFQHYPDKVFWAPIWLVWHYVWKRTIGRI